MDKKILCVVVGIVMDSKGRFLLSHRLDPETPKADGTWDFVGGKLEFGEKPEQGVVREVLEESGLKVKVLRLVPFIPTEIWRKKDKSLVQVVLISYLCKITGGKLHTKNFDHKIKALKFVAYKDFKKYKLLSNVKEIAQASLALSLNYSLLSAKN